MLSRRTVFVVGAGASCELGLPSGEGLKAKIADALSIKEDHFAPRFADAAVQEALEELSGRDNQQWQDGVAEGFFEAATTLKDALPFALSIDNFLDAQREDSAMVELGKIGIAQAILNAERGSKIGGPRGSKSRLQDLGRSRFPHKVEVSWHLRLVQLLTAGRPVGEIDAIFDDVAFIVFNYDRCLEFYLAAALTTYYHVEEAVARAAMRNLKVIHPYGTVGALPWQNGAVKVQYGGTGQGRLLNVAAGIRTFTESAEEGVVQEVRTMMQEAETIVFMGFGFLPQNVELLTVDHQSNANRVFFTTKGISDADVSVVEDDISAMLNKREANSIFPTFAVQNFRETIVEDEEGWQKFVERGTCLDLMNNNWLRLTRR